MSTDEMKMEFARMRKRMNELEAANGLRGLVPAAEVDPELAEACRQAGIGVRTLQGRSKERDTARKRRVVAAILRKKAGWTISDIAEGMKKTERAIEKML